MRIGVGVGVGFERGGLGAGGGGGTAPVISGQPLLTDEEISIAGTLPITLYGKNSATSTPLSTGAIEAAPDDTLVLAGGVNYLPALTLQVAPGTWYYNYFAKNAAGSSAVETESYVIAAPPTTPAVKGQTENNGFGGSQSVSFGATAAGDSILIVVGIGGNAITATAPNFAAKASYSSSSYCIYILEWDGGGSRPNSSSVTVTFSGSVNNCTMGFVIEQAVAITGTSNATASATTHTLNTITTAGNALTLAACIGGNVSQTPTGPGSPPSLDPAIPADAGYWQQARSGNFQMYVFAYETPDAGQTDAIEITTGSATTLRYALTAVEEL